jgi:hypothetical protein
MESPRRAKATTSFPPGLKNSFQFPVSGFWFLVSRLLLAQVLETRNRKLETSTYGVTVSWNGTLLLNEPEVTVTVRG